MSLGYFPMVTAILHVHADTVHATFICAQGVVIKGIPGKYLQPVYEYGLMPTFVARFLAISGHVDLSG